MHTLTLIRKTLNILSIMSKSMRGTFKKVVQKSKVPFVEPLLASAMILERHIDASIKQVSDYGLSQFKILASIERAAQCKGLEDATQSAIAELWGVSEAAISRQAAILEHDKLLIRTPDPTERRKIVLRLTAKGKLFVTNTVQHIDKELAKIFKHISINKRQQLGKDMYTVAETLTRYIHK